MSGGAGQIGEQRPAELGTSATAVIRQEGDQRPDALEFRAIPNDAPITCRRDEPGARQDGKMRRKRVMRHVEESGDLTSGKVGLPGGDELPEDVQPGRLGQRRERLNGCSIVHMSGHTDIW